MAKEQKALAAQTRNRRARRRGDCGLLPIPCGIVSEGLVLVGAFWGFFASILWTFLVVPVAVFLGVLASIGWFGFDLDMFVSLVALPTLLGTALCAALLKSMEIHGE